MGNLSEHFNYQDFTCKCPLCKGKSEYKIHLGLVGILEAMGGKLRRPIKIIQAYRCEEQNEKLAANKKSFHMKGKAAHIYVNDVTIQELYKLVKEFDDITLLDWQKNWEFAERYTKAIGDPQVKNDRFLTIIQTLVIWINAKNLGVACREEVPESIKTYIDIMKLHFDIDFEHLLKE